MFYCALVAMILQKTKTIAITSHGHIPHERALPVFSRSSVMFATISLYPLWIVISENCTKTINTSTEFNHELFLKVVQPSHWSACCLCDPMGIYINRASSPSMTVKLSPGNSFGVSTRSISRLPPPLDAGGEILHVLVSHHHRDHSGTIRVHPRHDAPE